MMIGKDYFDELKLCIDATENGRDEFTTRLANLCSHGGVYICGNGGSAAIANHFAADMNKKAGLKLINSLCENQSMITALANDVSYDEIFRCQLYYETPRVNAIIVVSSSGNSPNIIKAVEWGLETERNVIALTGFKYENKVNTLLKADPKHIFHVPCGVYGVIEDIHMSILHAVIEKTR